MYQLTLNITRISGFESREADVFVEAQFRGELRKELVRRYTGKVLGNIHWTVPPDAPLQLDEVLRIIIRTHGQKTLAEFNLILQRVAREGQILIDDCFCDTNSALLSNTRLLGEVTYLNLENADLTEQWVKGVAYESLDDKQATNQSPLDEKPGHHLFANSRLDISGKSKQSRIGSALGSLVGDVERKAKNRKKSVFQKMSKFGKKSSQKGTTIVTSDSSSKNLLDEQQLDLFDESLLKPLRVSSKVNEDYDSTINNALFKTSGFQVNVHVIEAQRLAGAELHPFVIVEVADQKKVTKVIEETVACPYFDEAFVFDFTMPQVQMLNSIIKLTVLNKGGMFSKDDNIGEFKIDVGTVYKQPGHCFFNRWAILFDPDDVANGTSGALKLTLSAIGKGDAIKPPADPEGDDDVIEGNELLPDGFPVDRQLAHYILKVYKAIGLPNMSSGFMGQFKKAFGDVKDMVDPFVQITFSGLTGSTSVMENDYTPEWFEEIVFSEMFPPMCSKVNVDLKDKNSLTSANIGTFIIDINEISCEQIGQGFMPTFGPSWVNLYGSLRSYGFSDQHDNLNRGMGEGVAFRGQLLLGLEVKLADPLRDVMSVAVLEEHNRLEPLSTMYTGKKEEFFLFCAIIEASMIERSYAGKPIQFELSIGNYGNNIDGQNAHFKKEEKKSPEKTEKDKEKEKPKEKAAKKSDSIDEDEEEIISNPFSDSKQFQPKPVEGQRDYFFLDFGHNKPCVFVKSQLPDLKERHFRQNILEKTIQNTLEKLQNLSERLQLSEFEVPNGMADSIKFVLGKFLLNCSEYKNITSQQLTNTKIAGKTKLDLEKIRYAHREIEQVKHAMNTLKIPETSTSSQPFLDVIRTIRLNVNRLKKHTKEPQPGLPDIFLWMVSGGRRVAYARIPAATLLYSSTGDMETGRKCAKMQTIFLKLPGNLARGQSGWSIQAKLETYLWLSHSRNRKEAFEKLPEGFDLRDTVDDPFKTMKASAKTWDIPRTIRYKEQVRYMLRAHLYQARGLLPADDTGLSDPFARVIIGSQCMETQILDETLNPTWDEMLLFQEITLNYRASFLKHFKILAIVEIFDSDSPTSYEFIGRTKVCPIVKEAWQCYEKPDWPPDLEWHTIQRGTENAGELLAQFELLEIPEDEIDREDKLPPSICKENRFNSKAVFPVPPEIRPVLCTYRLEILFWGLRNLKRVNMLKVDKPKVVIEIGNSSITSETIFDIDKKPNFSIPVKILSEIDLPVREVYMPPVTIRVMDCRTFGRETLVGTHSVNSLAPLVHKSFTDILESKSDDEMSTISAPALLKDMSVDPKSHLGQTIIEMGGADSDPNAICMQDLQKLATIGVENYAFQMDFIFDDTRQLLSRNPSVFVPAQDSKATATTDMDKPTVFDNQNGTLRCLNNEFIPTSETKLQEHVWEKLENNSVAGSNVSSKLSQKSGKSKNSTQLKKSQSLATLEMSKTESRASNSTDEEDYEEKDGKKENNSSKKKKKKKSKKERKDEKEKEEQVLDWWTKYFASIRTAREKQPDLNSMLKATHVQTPEMTAAEMADKEDITEEKHPSKKRDKKFWKKKLRNNEILFEVFDDELEKQPEFEGFVDLFESFKLRRGKKDTEDEEENARVVGVFKGKVKLYKLPLEPELQSSIDTRHGLFTFLPSMDPLPIIARVYVIMAVNLHPMDTNGKADPYLQVTLGKQSQNTKEEYVSKNLNPTFGKLFEFEFTLPLESSVTVSVYDYDMVGSNDLIGETVVDLENRFYSKHRACCGLSQSFDTFGYNKWRDADKPSQILAKLCRDLKLAEPIYSLNRVKVGGRTFKAPITLIDEMGNAHVTHEHLALKALRNWHTIPKHGFHLVPEHIETRPLFNPEKPGIEQGRVQMWVDLFAKDTHVPKPVDITPRIPKGYELRVIIWNTDDVILEEENLFGERMSDIYVRGWLKGPHLDVQSTDVHYRSLTGEGNFNWRFVFPFEYLAAEEKIVFKQKESTFSMDETEFKIPLRLQLQVWDADAFSSDDILGSLTIDLNRFPRGAKSTRRCTLDLLKTDGSVRQMSIFRNKRVKGWWPFTRKNDDQEFELTGKVEIELSLVTAEEAETSPVGLGREAPIPLKPPNRPDSTLMWFIQPLKSLALMLWRNHWWLIIRLLFLLLLTCIFALFIYSAPGYMMKKLLGA